MLTINFLYPQQKRKQVPGFLVFSGRDEALADKFALNACLNSFKSYTDMALKIQTRVGESHERI